MFYRANSRPARAAQWSPVPSKQKQANLHSMYLSLALTQNTPRLSACSRGVRTPGKGVQIFSSLTGLHCEVVTVPASHTCFDLRKAQCCLLGVPIIVCQECNWYERWIVHPLHGFSGSHHVLLLLAVDPGLRLGIFR